MKKFILLAGLAAMVAVPSVAVAGDRDGGYNNPPPPPQTPPGPVTHEAGPIRESVGIRVDYKNELDASIKADVSYDKHLVLRGGGQVHADIYVDTSAVAVSDPKQLIETNAVTDKNPNTVNVGSVTGTGNVGVNAVAGNLNQQANVASIASANSSGTNGGYRDHDDDDDRRSNDNDNGNGNDDRGDAVKGGWAEATTVSLQKVFGNGFVGGGANNTTVTSVTGSGNIGVNAATGAFNAQENVLTLAVVKDGALAEANAGVMQLTAYNTVVTAPGGVNNTTIGTVNGTGNMGVNAASGVGNIQSNSLTIATSN